MRKLKISRAKIPEFLDNMSLTKRRREDLQSSLESVCDLIAESVAQGRTVNHELGEALTAYRGDLKILPAFLQYCLDDRSLNGGPACIIRSMMQKK